MVAMSILTDLSDAAAALAEQAAPRIIAVRGNSGRAFSGFTWRTGLAVTAEEALDGEDEAEVLLADGRALKANLAGRDPSTDVALLKFETGEFGEWPVAGAVKPASFALVAGRSEDSLIASLTAVSEAGPAWRSMRGGEIDARLTLALRLGGQTEGAAVVAPDGGLIGMAVTSARRRAIVIPASTIARSVATLAEKGYIPRGWLGVMLHPAMQGNGAIVLSVEDGSPAAKAGLLVGDVITTWNGETVQSVGDVSRRLVGAAVNTKIKLGVVRGGSPSDVDVILGEHPRG
jgi:S1-C subfamily serine protease